MSSAISHSFSASEGQFTQGVLAVVAFIAFAASSAGATGVNGFVPTDTNVISPQSGEVTTIWKQTGQCGASAVQISPSWVLSANHAHCSVGTTFRRSDGATAVVDLEPGTQPGQRPLADFDLHLARLATPLPYAGTFAPLVDQFADTQKNLCRSLDLLLAGYSGGFRVGWASAGIYSTGLFKAIGVSADPRVVGPAGSDHGDSGGGVFLFGSGYSEGALAGLMQGKNTGFSTSRGFPLGVRGQMNAVLSNPALNSSGESIQWLDASVFTSAPYDRPQPPLMLDGGDAYDNLAVPQYGLVTTNVSGKLQVRIPESKSCDDSRTSVYADSGYRIRMIRADAGTDAAPFEFSVSPTNRNFMVPSGVTAGDWYMTVTARVTNPITGLMGESLSAARTLVHVPEIRPVALERVDVTFEPLDQGDGQLHWRAIFKAVASADGPSPQGILWTDTTMRIMARSTDLGENDPWMVYDYDKLPNGFKPGDVFTVYAYPYIGAAIGPVTPVFVTAPATLP